LVNSKIIPHLARPVIVTRKVNEVHRN